MSETKGSNWRLTLHLNSHEVSMLRSGLYASCETFSRWHDEGMYADDTQKWQDERQPLIQRLTEALADYYGESQR